MPFPTLGQQPTLATPDDVVARLGRNMNQMEALRVDAMLQDGSAIIRRYARTDFMFHSQDVLNIIADAGVIKLPQKPVVSVDAVTWVAGAPEIPNIPVYWYIFDNIDTITIPEPRHSAIINLPAMWYFIGWYSDTFQVTYTHGLTSVPNEIIGLLCGAIISELSTPTMSATIQSEAIGAYSYTMRRSISRSASGSPTPMAGMYAALLDFGMEAILLDYRKTRGTISVKL
jgi:hypothetical protein